MVETKQQKFERIAERRVSEVIKKIGLIGNLADKKNYSYTETHVKEIFDAIDGECKAMKAKFRFADEKERGKFSFKAMRR